MSIIKSIKYIINFFLLIISYIIYAGAWLRKKWILSHRLQAFPVPIIVVGNLTLGGSGKTPFVCALVKILQEKGYRPGVVSRGYKAKKSSSIPYILAPLERQQAQDCGDEPLLIAQLTQVPVVICKKRPLAVARLLQHCPEVNIIISDDGLQHYYLDRDIEVVLFNKEFNFNNTHLFPAGPLREPLSRLKTVDFVISATSYPVMQRLNNRIYLLNNAHYTKSLTSLAAHTVYAVAGIAYPERFFKDLKVHHIQVIECPFADHYEYTQKEWDRFVQYSKKYPVLITEKDAVKLKPYYGNQNYKDNKQDINIWVVSLITELSDIFIEQLMAKIKIRENKNKRIKNG